MYQMCQELQCPKRVKLMLEQGLQQCRMLLVQRQVQLRHLIWNLLPQRLARCPALQAHLTAYHRENRSRTSRSP